MVGALSILAVGLVIGVAIAWALPGLPQLLSSVAARTTPRRKNPPVNPIPALVPRMKPTLVKLHADDARNDGAGDDDPMGYGTALDRSQCDPGRLDVAVKLSSIVAELQKNIGSWIDFFESKFFGACFGGLVSVVTLQMAGANARSTFALTLFIVLGYWLAFDKPR
jgi:hypothetical protein